MQHRVRCILIVIATLLLPVAGCQRQLVPTPNLYVDAEIDPFAEVPAVFRTSGVDLLYVTDRKAENEGDDGSLRYGYRRSDALAYGSCAVEIGHDVTWDELVEASRSRERSVRLPLRLGMVIEIGRFPETPPPLEWNDGELVDSVAYLAEREAAFDDFHDELRRRLALTPRKEAFVFVHGFNNTMQDAAFRLAELWHFLGRGGVPILYTWPAGHPGIIKGYTRDRESSEFTIFHLKEFLRALAACPELDRIHVISHSRGTDVTATALRELWIAVAGAGQDGREVHRIGTVVFAAPDVDARVSSQRNSSEQMFRLYDQAVLYVTPNDRALGSAEWLFSTRGRLGKLRPEEMDERTRQRLGASRRRTQIIDARVRTDWMGHGYFLSNPAVFSDLLLVLRYDRSPGAEHGRPLTEIAPNWFILDDDYPREAAPMPEALQGN